MPIHTCFINNPLIPGCCKQFVRTCAWVLLKSVLASFHNFLYPVIPWLKSFWYLCCLPPYSICLVKGNKLIPAMLKMSLSCWTPMIRRSCFTVVLKFRSKAPLKKLRKLCLSLRRFWSWLRVMESLKKASRHCRTMIGTNSKQQLDKEVWGHLLATKRFWRRRRGLGPARVQFFNSSSPLQGVVDHHVYCWTL